VSLHFLQFLNQQREVPHNFAPHLSIAKEQRLRVFSLFPLHVLLYKMRNLISFVELLLGVIYNIIAWISNWSF
jgi:hypothetical protein